jgi:hypothetical protein
MKIDPYTKTITLERIIDYVPAMNYLTRYLTKNDAKEWTVKTKREVCSKTTK